jgi:hypothetical protein
VCLGGNKAPCVYSVLLTEKLPLLSTSDCQDNFIFVPLEQADYLPLVFVPCHHHLSLSWMFLGCRSEGFSRGAVGLGGGVGQAVC